MGEKDPKQRKDALAAPHPPAFPSLLFHDADRANAATLHVPPPCKEREEERRMQNGEAAPEQEKGAARE